MTSEEMSCSETGIQEVERRYGEESVDFEDSVDKDESQNIFDEENVPSEPVLQPYVSLKLSDVLRSILASLKDASVKVRLILNQEMRGKMLPPLQLRK